MTRDAIDLTTAPVQAALAPMAGVTDLPFRQLCQDYGAAWVTTEMISSNPNLRGSKKSSQRLTFGNEPVKVIQIVGYCPNTMAQAAQHCEEVGADVVDINMGCPAKKVCSKAAGSALLRDEKLVAAILENVVKSVQIPVTLKYRTGWDTERNNACTVAKIAESVGVRRLVLHGRSRACGYGGTAEYNTIAEVVKSVNIPVIANGDIDSPEKAKHVLSMTGAAGVMIGRAAQGRPWLFSEIKHYLTTGHLLPRIGLTDMQRTVMHHIEALYEFYGVETGKRIARKHVRWYFERLPGGKSFSQSFNKLDCPRKQLASALDFFERIIDGEEMAA